MARSSYLGLARLGSHPAFEWREAALVCPYTVNYGCEAEPFTRVSEYDKHFLSHDPTPRAAFRWLSGKTYDRVAKRRGWPSADEALDLFGDDTV